MVDPLCVLGERGGGGRLRQEKGHTELLFVLAVFTLYKKVGDEVVLQPGTVPDTITSVMWKDGPNIAVQWNGRNIDHYRHFKGMLSCLVSMGSNMSSIQFFLG